MQIIEELEAREAHVPLDDTKTKSIRKDKINRIISLPDDIY